MARVSSVPPRRPLPARVYWVRRLLVLAVALALVFAVARLLGGGGGDDTSGPSARPVGAASSPAAVTTATAVPTTADASPTPRRNKRGKLVTPKPSPTPLAEPSGPCVGKDIITNPQVKGSAFAGRSTVFDLVLTARTTPACTFEASADSVVVRLTSGSDRIWSTQECRGAVAKQSVVVRKDVPVSVSVTWNGQRSDADCTGTTGWAESGYYHVAAAVFGGDPVTTQFLLQAPPRPTVTTTPTPSPKSAKKRR